MASIKLVAIAKDEAAYLAEWVYHHLSIGIDEIDIYLNGITDNSYQVMRLINDKYANVNFYDADRLMGTSVRANKSFQQIIYHFAWSTERRRRKLSHLAFLDIDEYLVSSSFGQNIDSMLRAAGNFDILSNLWYSDLPRNAEPFSRVFEESQMLQKMSIVKSIGRLKSKIGIPIVHNFNGITRNRSNINALMSNGKTIKYAAAKKFSGKRIDPNFCSSLIGQYEPWFVFHRIFRSHDEYCASLMRGRKHRSNDAPIKDNRSGFIAMEPSKMTVGAPMQYKINQRQNYNYQRNFEHFINKCNLGNEVLKGQNFVRQKYKDLEQLVAQKPNLLKQYSEVFKGTLFER